MSNFILKKVSGMNKLSLCFVISMMLSACNDSSGGVNSAANLASVNAGDDQSVLEGLPITLDATVYPEGGTVIWTQISGPTIDGFPTADELAIEVVSPAISLDTIFIFEAEYTSLDGQIVNDEVTVEVANVDYEPIAIITLEDEDTQPFNTYEEIFLSAADSYDLDGDIRQYSWTQVDDNDALTFITDTSSDELEITAPFVTSITNYTLQLTVTDNMGLIGTNTINVQIAASDKAIAANAGVDQAVDEFTTVELDASASASSVSEVTCQWEQTYPTTTLASLEDEDKCITSFAAPDVDTQEEFIFVVNVTDTDLNTDSDQVVITINPINLGLLHDTGITNCFSSTEEIACNDPDYPMQDADTGRDAVSTLLDKSGDGVRSFDFTKFDVNGDELPNDSLVFSCVRDNFTGLIWEVKQQSSIPAFQFLRGAENYYSMDESLEALLSCSSDNNCGQEELITSVNETGYCGGANWRLPTYLELLNILDYNDIEQSNMLASDFFPNLPDNAALGHSFYWVSDGSAEGGSNDFNWVIDLATGDDSAILMSESAYVILVRTP